MAEFAEQPLQPQRVTAGFDAYDPLARQSTVELRRFSSGESLFRMLSSFCVDHSNLLETRMEITAYNLHDGSFRPSLGLCKLKFTRTLLGAVVVMKSSAAPRVSCYHFMDGRGVEKSRHSILDHVASGSSVHAVL